MPPDSDRRPPYLSILRPSPTTVRYTLTTASPSPLRHYILLPFLRIFLVALATTILVLGAVLRPLPPWLVSSGLLRPGGGGGGEGEAWRMVVLGPFAAVAAAVAVGGLSFFLVFRRFHTGIVVP